MEDTTNLLVQAIANDDAEIIKNILTNQNPVFDVNQRIDKAQSTALHLAVSKNSYNVTKLLLQSGANVNIRNRDDVTCFHAAVEANNADLVKLFLDENICAKENFPDVNARVTCGDTPLYRAIHHKNISMLQLLLSHGADPDMNNTPFVEGNTLHNVLSSKDEDFTEDLMLNFVKLLVEHGADVNLIDDFTETPLYVAIQKDHRLEVIECLLRNGADVNANNGAALFEAIQTKNLNLVKYLLKHGADVNVKHKRDGGSPLMALIRCVYGEEGCDLINLFLDHGADINASDNFDATPLITSIVMENIEAFNLLIERGVAVCTVRSKSDIATPLSYVLYAGVYDSVKTLIDKGALEYQRNFSSDTEIIEMSGNNADEEILQLLMDNGVKVSDKDLIANVMEIERFKILFSTYNDANPASLIKHRILYDAISEAQDDVVEYLLEQGADINYKQRNCSPSALALRLFDDVTASRGIAELVLKQMAFLSAQNLYVDEESVNLMESNQYTSEYFMEFKKKVEDMRKNKVCTDHYTTYYDVLTKRNNALVKHLRCKMVRIELSSENYKELFERFFSCRIEKNFGDGVKRLMMIDKFQAVLEDIFKDILGNDIICMISEYYNDAEFKVCLG